MNMVNMMNMMNKFYTSIFPELLRHVTTTLSTGSQTFVVTKTTHMPKNVKWAKWGSKTDK
jgi:hypothetical protein